MKARVSGFQNGSRCSSRSRQRSLNEPRAQESRPPSGADVCAEGVLEMRGPGKVARWEEKFFRLEGCVLDAFNLGNGQPDSSISVHIGDVHDLTLEENRRECCFTFNGTKIRLRAKSHADALYWFRHLEAAGHSTEPEPVAKKEVKELEDTRASLLTTMQKPWLAKREASRSSRRARETEMSPARTRPHSQEPNQHIPPWSPTSPSKSAPPPPETLGTMPIASDSPRPPKEERKQALQYLGDLNALHGQKLKRLEEQRARAMEAERLRVEAEKFQERNATGIRWNAADLDPHEAANRLYEDHRTRKMHMKELEYKFTQDEMMKLEQARSPRPRRAQSESVLRTNPNEAGKRMHDDAMRRVQEKQKKMEDQKAIDGDLLEMLAARGVPSGNTTVRHHDLYQDAQIRRELMDKKRKNEEHNLAKLLQENSVHKKDGPADIEYLDKLYAEHERRARRQKVKLVEQERAENAMLQKLCGGDGSARSRSTSSRRRASSPGGKPGTSLILSMTLDGINGTLLSECVREGLLHKFKSAIIQAITDEASHVCVPKHIEVKSLNLASDCCHVELTIQFPSKSSTTAMQMRLGSSTTLCERIATTVMGLDGISDMVTGNVAVTDVNIMPVAQKPPEPYVPKSKQSPAHGSCTPRSMAAQADKRARSRSASQSHAEPIKQADVAFNSILEAIQVRSGSKMHAVNSLDSKEFVPLLQAAVNLYNEAHSDCLGSDGYTTLCDMASARLCPSSKLLPEFQVFNSFSEPLPIRQVQEGLDELLASAERAQLFLQGRLFADGRADSWPVGEIHVKPSDIPAALFAYNPGPKSRSAAEVKSWVTYGPAEGPKRHRNLLDLARISLVFPTPQMVQKGLDMILAKLEVIAIRNYFSAPGRLGARHIDVSVIIQVEVEVENGMVATIPHICELRLEDMTFYKANKSAKKHLDQFFARLGARMEHLHLDRNSMVYLARHVLFTCQTSHNLRVFRRQLAWRHGSLTAAWRKALGNERVLPFVKLRDTAQALRLGENMVKYWAELCPGLGGTCSLFELDPENTSLLALFRSRLLSMCRDESTPEDLFARLSFRLIPERAGCLYLSEFRNVTKPLRFSLQECDCIFQSLDSGTGSPASITISDLAWLTRLPSIVELRHINLTSVSGPDEADSFRSMYWPPIYGTKMPPEVPLEPKSTEPMTARGNARDASPIKSALKKGGPSKQAPDVSYDAFATATPTRKAFSSPAAGSAETKAGSQYHSQDSQWRSPSVGRAPGDWRPNESRDLGTEDTELSQERPQREGLEKDHEALKAEHRQDLEEKENLRQQLKDVVAAKDSQDAILQELREALERLTQESSQAICEAKLEAEEVLRRTATAEQDMEARHKEVLRRTSTAELEMEARHKGEQEELRTEQDQLRADVRRSMQLTEDQRKALMADAEELRRLAKTELEEEEQTRCENSAAEEQEIARLRQERDELLSRNEAMERTADQQRDLEMKLQLDTKLLDELASEREALILQNSSLKLECQEYEDRVKCDSVLIDGGAAELRQRNCQIESDNLQIKEMTEAYHEHESAIVQRLREENAELRARSGSIRDLPAADTQTVGRRLTGEEASAVVKIQAVERGRRGRVRASERREEYENESF